MVVGRDTPNSNHEIQLCPLRTKPSVATICDTQMESYRILAYIEGIILRSRLLATVSFTYQSTHLRTNLTCRRETQGRESSTYHNGTMEQEAPDGGWLTPRKGFTTPKYVARQLVVGAPERR